MPAAPHTPLPPLAALRQIDTCRLIPSRFADMEDSVLAPLAEDDAHLRELFELDNATNARLVAEYGGAPGIGVDELVFGVPHFRIINAAYTYARPEGARFNDGERGAWYCAFDMQTALAEIIFHKTVEYQEIDYFADSVSYQSLLADFSAASTTCAARSVMPPASTRPATSPRKTWPPSCSKPVPWASSSPACGTPAAPTWPASALPWSAMFAKVPPIG